MRRLTFSFLLLVIGCRADWSGKRAWTNCKEAIAGGTPWPSPPCEAMTMCENEAQLAPVEHAALRAQMRRSGCGAP
jgi:hypothetical protein